MGLTPIPVNNRKLAPECFCWTSALRHSQGKGARDRISFVARSKFRVVPRLSGVERDRVSQFLRTHNYPTRAGELCETQNAKFHEGAPYDCHTIDINTPLTEAPYKLRLRRVMAAWKGSHPFHLLRLPPGGVGRGITNVNMAALTGVWFSLVRLTHIQGNHSRPCLRPLLNLFYMAFRYF